MFSNRTQVSTFLFVLCFGVSMLAGQSTPTATNAVVPTLASFSGVLTDLNGKPLTGVTGVTFSLYKDADGGAPLWMEVQNVRPDKTGHYTLALGSTTNEGLPTSLFASGEARWLGVQPEGQAEQPRVLLLSVPYALKAADAETVGGLPPSAFMLAPSASNATGSTPSSTLGSPLTAGTAQALLAASVTGSGTTNFVPLWTSASNIGNSVVFQSGTGSTAKVGLNTTTPASTLDVKGGGTIRGTLILPATGTATTTVGKTSFPIDLTASAFSSSAATAVNQVFQWQAEPAGNNTATPSGTLNLLFGSGSTKPAETGLKLSSKGLFTFATGQTFPGTGDGTITGVIAGTDLTGGGLSGKVTLNLDTSKIPQLGASNDFTAPQEFKANTGIGVAPSGTSYTPLSVGTANSFGTWFSLANTSSGGHTWNIISAGAGNSEGAGNLGITDLTGKSTIWLEGNTNTTNLNASGSAGGAILDADVFGTNTGAVTPGLRFGGSTSGEGIASNRVAGINRFGLQLFTELAPRLSILQDGRVGIGATHPVYQLEVDSASNGYAAIFAQGGAAPNGSGADGSDGIVTFGNTGDLTSGSTYGGNGISAFGAGGTNDGGAGGVFTGGASVNGSGAGDGINAFAGGPTGAFGPFAGYFDGDIDVNGGVYNNSASTKIDHPLDPANKYLFHSSVESSEMKNIYDGNIVTDANGEAMVELPEWFESLNRDFRYQLTVIGQFAQAIVAGKIADHRFTIRTNKPNVEVSWQVTGIRQDAWANAHRAPVEQEKSAREKGHYLHPELYGAPEEAGIGWARHPEMMKHMKEMRQKNSRAPQTTNLVRQ